MTRLSLSMIAGALVLVLSLPAQAADYRIDPGHSFIQFRIQHLGFSWLIGRFNTLSGSFTFDPAAGPAGQSITVEVDTASVDTNHAERDKHLRAPDFLDVATYPKATFVSSGYTGDAKGGTMAGTLTLHGVSKPVEIAVTKIGEGKDPWGGYRAGVEGRLTIVRKDYGMTRSLGPASESMELELYVEGIRKK